MSQRATFIRTKLIPAIIIGALAMGAGMWLAKLLIQYRMEADPLAATRFPAARPVQAFSLLDHKGDVFDNQTLAGHWSFLFFGYTHCPDVCPTTMSVLNSVAQRLQESGETARFVMVTVDPARDTAEKLGQFVTYFNGDFLGVTGSESALEQLTKQLGILHMKVNDAESASAYLVDHTASVFLFDPDGNFHAVFSPPLSAETMAGDFSKMARAYR